MANSGSRSWRRLFRGMLGIGAAFGAVAAAIMGLGSLVMFVFFRSQMDWDDLDFLLVAPFVWVGIAFGLGMAYAGLLSLIARGRAFRDVSIARVASAGAAVGLLPSLVVLGGALTGGRLIDVLTPLVLFPPISAAVATATLLIARKARPVLGAGDDPAVPRSLGEAPHGGDA